MTFKEFIKWFFIIVIFVSVALALFLFIVLLATGELPPILDKYL